MRAMLLFLLVVVIAATNATPAGAQSAADRPSGILASALRSASTLELAQQGGTAIRRLRSRNMAVLGAGVLGLGVALFASPPKCGYSGAGIDDDGWSSYSYRAEYKDGECDIEIDVTRREHLLIINAESAGKASLEGFHRFPGKHREYFSDVTADAGFYVVPEELGDLEPTRSDIWKRTGLAMAAGGGALLVFGLRRVEVPLRVDLTPDGGVLASRSLSW